MPPDPESTDLDRDVDASMRMFEKSKVGDAAAITPVKPSRVMLVLDGSSQDETALESARYLRETFNVETVMLDARDGDLTEDLAVARAPQVSGARPIARGEGDSYEVILAAIKTHSVDMLIVPCPFGRSFEHVGTDSAGTVMDVLLSRCPCPILAIRRDDQLLSECVHRVSVIVGGECGAHRTCRWGCFLRHRVDAFLSEFGVFGRCKPTSGEISPSRAIQARIRPFPRGILEDTPQAVCCSWTVNFWRWRRSPVRQNCRKTHVRSQDRPHCLDLGGRRR